MKGSEKSAISVTFSHEELTQHGTADFPLRTFTDITLAEETGIIPWHWHRELELISCLKGHINVYTGAELMTLHPGEAMFINSRVFHQVKPRSGEKPVHYSYCFAPEFLAGSSESLTARKYIQPFISGKGPAFYVIRPVADWEKEGLRIISELNKEALNENFGYEMFLQSRLIALFLLLLRNLPERQQDEEAELAVENSNVRTMLSYIRNHYADKISLDEIAGITSLSKSSCNRLFHSVVGCTPFEYLTEYRLKRSIHLLLESRKSITDIAYMCGFSDASYYCKIFRRKNGISPAKFRSLQETPPHRQ